ncbi:MAG: helix-turn-helix domain-containing protein, partial [Lachnospiraceae bacterium]|nr:helix-turn-helix domain-containing protein [Lachnospiraceae bacterium]
MEYSYKFRIYPNRVQENLIQRTFGCCRFVFNHFLAERMEQYKQ